MYIELPAAVDGFTHVEVVSNSNDRGTNFHVSGMYGKMKNGAFIPATSMNGWNKNASGLHLDDLITFSEVLKRPVGKSRHDISMDDFAAWVTDGGADARVQVVQEQLEIEAQKVRDAAAVAAQKVIDDAEAAAQKVRDDAAAGTA